MTAEDRREQLLKVARGAFARGGYQGTTSLEVSRQAGISEKLILKHFGTKEGLFRAAVIEPLIELFQGVNDDAKSRLDAGTLDTPEEAFLRVHRFLSTWASHVRQEGPLLLSFFAEWRDFPEVAERVTGLLEAQVEHATEILARAAEQSGCRPFDARVAVQAALGAATVAGMTSSDPDAFLTEYMNITLFGVLCDQHPARIPVPS